MFESTVSSKRFMSSDLAEHSRICRGEKWYSHCESVVRGLSSSSVVIHTVVTDPTIGQPGFDLSHHT